MVSLQTLITPTEMDLSTMLYAIQEAQVFFAIDSAIPKIAALALDDKNHEIWEPATHLLIAFSKPPTTGESLLQSILLGQTHRIVTIVRTSSEQFQQDNNRNSNSGIKTTYDFALSQIKSQMAKFMVSLESEDKRDLMVELLSSVSLDTAGQHFSKLSAASCNIHSLIFLVRRSISLRIASKILATESTNISDGHIQLLD
jgi:hypothetical protein